MNRIEMRPISGGAENAPQLEKPRTNFLVMTVSGGPGTGTTTAVGIMSAELGLHNFKAGELFRRWDDRFGTGERREGFTPRDPSLDRRIDARSQIHMVRAMRTGNPIIVESRLGGWLAKTKVKTGGPNILYTVSERIAAQRVWERRRRNPNFDQTVEEVRLDLRQRNRQDFAVWKQAHPDLPDNPINPGFRDGNRRIYDIFIDTDERHVEEVVAETYRQMRKLGFLEAA